MKVEHTVQIQVVMYYNTVVEDDTDHPMTDDQITEIVKDRMLEQGPGSRNFEAVDMDVEEEDIDRVVVLQTINADPESPGYLEDITDDFIDIQRKLKKGA